MDTKLKDYIEEHFDFAGLKKAGLFGKDIKKNDYEKIAARICTFFGYESIYEYKAYEITDIDGCNAATMKLPDEVDEKGNYKVGDAGLLSTVQSHFECPICTCSQEPKDIKGMYQKCKGCKRSLGVVIDMKGNIHVWDKKEEKK